MTVKGIAAGAAGLNSGKVDGALFASLVVSGIFVPYDWYFAVAITDSDVTILANLQTQLSAVLLHDTYASRGHYVGPFEAFTDRSEATTYQTLGYGRKVKTQRRIITKEYQILEGGLQYWRSIQSFEGKIDQYKWLEIDSEGVLYGTYERDATTGAVIGLTGFRLSALEPQDRVQANRNTVEEHILNLTFQDSAEANEDLYAIESGIDLDAFVADLGIIDVVMKETGVMASHVLDIRVLAGDGSIDITQTLPLLLAAANLVAYNDSSGTAVGITSAAIVGNKLRVTFNTGSAGWSVGTIVNVGLASVSTLVTAGFKYYECAQKTYMARAAMVA